MSLVDKQQVSEEWSPAEDAPLSGFFLGIGKTEQGFWTHAQLWRADLFHAARTRLENGKPSPLVTHWKPEPPPPSGRE